MKSNHKKNCQCGMCKAIRGETKEKNNPHYGHYKYNIPKKFLITEYIQNKKSMNQIAKIIGCTTMTIYHKLVKYNIPRRTSWDSLIGKKRPEHSKALKGRKNLGVSEANKNRTGKDALNYIDGRVNTKHYCVEPTCNNEICYSNWEKGEGKCQSCANSINMKGNIPWNKGLMAIDDNRILAGDK